MNLTRIALITGALLTGCLYQRAQAQLWNTGVDASRNLLTLGATDPHYGGVVIMPKLFTTDGSQQLYFSNIPLWPGYTFQLSASHSPINVRWAGQGILYTTPNCTINGYWIGPSYNQYGDLYYPGTYTATVPERILKVGANTIYFGDGYGGYCSYLQAEILADNNTLTAKDCPLNCPQQGGSQSTCPGMAGYSFQSQFATLHVEDTPLEYTPPVGPQFALTLAYNQVDSASSNMFNFGNRWSSTISSYLIVTETNATCWLPGGGGVVYVRDSATNSTFLPLIQDFTVLRMDQTNGYILTYPDGTQSIYAYNDGVRSFLTQEVDAQGNSLTFSYQTSDGWVLLTAVTDAIGQTTRVQYDIVSDAPNPWHVSQVTDPSGRKVGFSYAANGYLQSITDPVGIVSAFSYATNGDMTILTTPYGTTTFTVGRGIIQATDSQGQTECLQAVRYAAQLASGLQYPTNMIADVGLGDNVSVYWDRKAWAQGSNSMMQARATRWATSKGSLTAMMLASKTPLEQPVWYNYPGQTDIYGNGITNPQPSKIGRVLDDGSTQMISLTYDSFGNPTNVVDAAGRVTRYVFSTNGIDLLQVLRRNGTTNDVIAILTYNSQHLPVTSVIAGISNQFGYTASGLLVAATNAIGQAMSYNYDVNGYLTNITGYVPGDTLGITYDGAGRVYSLTDSQGYAVTNGYDALNRLTNSTLPDGSSILALYDKLDVAQVKGRDNRWTYQTHDANRKLTDVQDPAGRIFHYEWCGCGALESITDPKGQMTTWVRDIQKRPTQKVYADLTGDTIAYESYTSRVKKTTDAAGKAVSVAYNADDTIKQVTYSGGPTTPSVSFTYDTNYSRLTRMVDGIGTNLISYVPAGQPGAGGLQSLDGPLPNDTITYGYDALGRPLTFQIGSALSSVQYDQLGRVGWSSNMLGVTTIQYVDATSRPALVSRPNGLFTAFSHTAVSDGSRLQSMLTTNAAGQVVEQYDYNYDTRDLLTTQTCTIGTNVTVWVYNYDPAQQLSDATQYTQTGTVIHRYVYGYDPAGNRTTEQIDTSVSTENPSPLNQLTSRVGGGIVKIAGFISETGAVTVAGSPAAMLSPTNFVGTIAATVGTNVFPVIATDFNANATTNWYQIPITANGLTSTLTYDSAGNLLTKANSAGTLAFGWDGADRCTAITNGIYRTALAYDGLSRWARITEYSNATTTADRRFVRNGTTLDEERDSTGTNVIKRFFGNGFWQGGTNYYYITDHLGSVVAVTLANGTVVARFEYDPYGRRTQTFGTLWVDFGFAGLFELTNGIKLAVWRVYDPSTGRWNSRDPIREDGGWNLYAYCNGDPINLSDVSGLATYPTDFVGPLQKGDSRMGRRFTCEEYSDILELLRRETLYGTRRAARMSMITYGTSPLTHLNSSKGVIVITAYGGMDIDWFTTTRGFTYSHNTYGSYFGGKVLWTTARFLAGLPISNPLPWPLSWSEGAEGVAVKALFWRASYHDLFTPEILTNYKPANCKCHK